MSTDQGLNERIAILETEMAMLKNKTDDILQKLDSLIAYQEKTKGFWGGVMAAGTALGAALGFLLSYIFQTKTGG